MLRTEDCRQPQAWSMRQHIGSAPPLRIDRSLVGHQADSYRMTRIRMQFAKSVFLENIDSRLHCAVSHSNPPLGHQRFVVSGNARQAKLFFLIHRQVERVRNSGGNMRAQRNHRSMPIRMDRIGKNNDVSVRHWIDPQRCACEPRMPE